jgi:hypothetical protein
VAAGVIGFAADDAAFVTTAAVAVAARAAGTATLATAGDGTDTDLATGGATEMTVGANSKGPAACSVGTTMLGNGCEFTTGGGAGL